MTELNELEQLMSPKELAKRLGMSEEWFARQRMLGKGIPYVRCGRAIRYRPSDVQAYLSQHANA